MQKAKFSCVVVIPVGPNASLPFLNDTVRSVFEYSDPASKILLIDNTKHGLDEAGIERHNDIDFLRCESARGADPLYGGLYYNLSKSFSFILNRYDFKTVLRLDDDALVIGPGADREAMEFFDRNPEVGCLGSYRFTCTGSKRDFTPAKRALSSEVSVKGALKSQRRWRSLRSLRNLARKNGYEDGEHCLGAATFYSKACLERFRRLGFLDRAELQTSTLGEDHLFGMMVVAAGLKMEDFATGQRPLGLAWQGLPASPEALIRMGKKVVHSVKFFEDKGQAAVRAEFRRLLSKSATEQPSSREILPETRIRIRR